MPLLSICIPTRDRIELLSRLLSTIGEIGGEIEVVISDNGVRDRIPSNLFSKNGVKLISQSGQLSAYQNWNAAIRASSGNFVLPISDDDYFRPGTITAILQSISVRPAGCRMLVMGHDVVHELMAGVVSEHPLGTTFGLRKQINPREFSEAFLLGWHPMNCSCIYDRTLFLDHCGGFDERRLHAADTILMLTAATGAVGPIGLIHEAKSVYSERVIHYPIKLRVVDGVIVTWVAMASARRCGVSSTRIVMFLLGKGFRSVTFPFRVLFGFLRQTRAIRAGTRR
jgi:glycosyltransferase involved in cell wall biosynthesis